MIQNVFQEISLLAEQEVFDEYITPFRWLIFVLITFFNSVLRQNILLL